MKSYFKEMRWSLLFLAVMLIFGIVAGLRAADAEDKIPKPGLSLFLDAGVIGLIMTNIGLILRRRNPGNNGKPGAAKICQQRGEKIAVLETKQRRFEQDITEIKGDIKKIMGAVVK